MIADMIADRYTTALDPMRAICLCFFAGYPRKTHHGVCESGHFCFKDRSPQGVVGGETLLLLPALLQVSYMHRTPEILPETCSPSPPLPFYRCVTF